MPGWAVTSAFRVRRDAAQIQYNLDNLRVAWGRVAMPLDRWQPNEDVDPGRPPPKAVEWSVREAMEMAQKLARKDIPTIASIWSAPSWALAAGGGGRGGRARINPEKWDNVCKSIGSYLEYMRKNYGAEPVLFSFNESDMGINVLQSPREHAEAIKRLGSCFASRGLKMRMLLGDTGNPTGDRFIDVARDDAEAAKYIGAVSFHSWNGGTIAQYKHFSDAAQKLNVPLLVAEGGLDPSAISIGPSSWNRGSASTKSASTSRSAAWPSRFPFCIGNSQRITQFSRGGEAVGRCNLRSDSGKSSNSA